MATKGIIPKNFYGMQKKAWQYNLGKKHSEEHKTKISKSMKGKILSIETRRKISFSKIGNKNGMFGKSELARKNGLIGLLKQQNSKQPTSIEKTLYDYLLLKGIIFEKQKLINGKFIVDAYIPSLNLVIEADGKYWHTLPEVIGKDKAENAYLEKCGFNLIRLSEVELKTGNFKERLVL